MEEFRWFKEGDEKMFCDICKSTIFRRHQNSKDHIGHFEKYHNTLLCASSALVSGAYLFKSPLLEWRNGIQSTAVCVGMLECSIVY